MVFDVTYIFMMTEKNVQFQYRAMIQSRHNLEMTKELTKGLQVLGWASSKYRGTRQGIIRSCSHENDQDDTVPQGYR
jgi:hypothetical protein